MGIKTANAVYTGGNIWLFYGETTDGSFFLTDDYGCTLLLNESPEDMDKSLYPDWQEEHKIRELFDSERVDFCNALLTWLEKEATSAQRGGITNEELEAYRDYMKEEV